MRNARLSGDFESLESETEARGTRGSYVCSGFVMDILKKSCGRIPAELAANPADVPPARLFQIMAASAHFECVGCTEFVGTSNERLSIGGLERKICTTFRDVDRCCLEPKLRNLETQLFEKQSRGCTLRLDFAAVIFVLRFITAIATGLCISFGGFFFRLISVVFLIPGFERFYHGF